MWAVRNPDKLEQISEDLIQASTGSPAPGSPGVLKLSAATRLSAAEISTGERLAVQQGWLLEESTHVGAEYVNAITKETIDAMGKPQAYQHFGSGAAFFKSIVRHVNKSVDYVAIDLKGASESQVESIMKFVGTLTKEQKDKIRYVNVK